MRIYKHVFHRLKSSCCTRCFKLCFFLLKCSRLLHLFQSPGIVGAFKKCLDFFFFLCMYIQSKNSSSSPKILLQPREKVEHLSSNILSVEMTSVIAEFQNLLCDRSRAFLIPSVGGNYFEKPSQSIIYLF